MKLKHEKNSGLNGIRTHDLCDIPTEPSSYLGASHLFIKDPHVTVVAVVLHKKIFFYKLAFMLKTLPVNVPEI